MTVTELFREVSQKVATRNGGYTRILKVGRRLGDGAEMAMMELVDYNENLLKEAKPSKAKTTRRGRTKKSDVEATETAKPEAIVAEAPVVEEASTEVSEEKAE